MGKESAENVHCRAENTGSSCPSLSHGQIRFPHRFTPQTDRKTDFAGFCPADRELRAAAASVVVEQLPTARAAAIAGALRLPLPAPLRVQMWQG
jgi:hypothetical protein